MPRGLRHTTFIHGILSFRLFRLELCIRNALDSDVYTSVGCFFKSVARTEKSHGVPSGNHGCFQIRGFMHGSHAWTKEDDQYILDYFGKLSYSEMARRLGDGMSAPPYSGPAPAAPGVAGPMEAEESPFERR